MDKAKINNLIETISSSLEQLKEALNDKQGMTIDDHRTVTIGKQTWLAENLRIDDGGEGIYFNEENSEYYYTWMAAGRIAKSIPGWHLPTLDEFRELAIVAGGISIAGDSLKSTTGWKYDCNGVDKFGFSAFPYGHHYIDEYIAVGKFATFWTSTMRYFNYAYYNEYNIEGGIDCSFYQIDRGLSVRLVKDS